MTPIRHNPTEADETEAREHQQAYLRWRHDPANPKLGIGRLLPQDLGYYADEREHCSHCKAVPR